MKKMVLLGSILVCVVGMACIASDSHAMLIDLVDTTGDHVVWDNVTDRYWIWDMMMFVSQDYADQQADIAMLSYFGVQDWRMADLTDMQALWAYTPKEIGGAFQGGWLNSYVMAWQGRYDRIYSTSPQGTLYWAYGVISDDTLPWAPPFWSSWHGREDNLIYNPLSDSLGAWVVSDGPVGVIPEPTTLLLLGIGLIGLLALRRKGPKHQ